MVQLSCQRIILRGDTHIDSLLERLAEPRVQRIIEPIITGEEGSYNSLDDDYLYVKDLGLIRDDRGTVEPANPIYAEVMLRTLSLKIQEDLSRADDIGRYQLARYLTDGAVNMDMLFREFQSFWRENAEICTGKTACIEALPQLVLQAFLQRILNGGGLISREMALGSRKMDLSVVYPSSGPDARK